MVERGPAEVYLALTALVIACCSLFVTTGQLLGQYFATADGYRRCQPSVMGPWAKRTRMRWRWLQWRFEVLFTTPDIFLHTFAVDRHHERYGTLPNGGEWVSGSHESESRTMVASRFFSNPSDEMVCWLPFLASLHYHEREMERHDCYRASYDGLLRHGRFRSGPALAMRERSWDFMSPDIVRPFAVTNISDIAILARRLGMVWKDFRPDDGILRAEGNGHMFTSTMARSIGIVLQYMQSGPRVISGGDEKNACEMALRKNSLYIPVGEADSMGFGILPGFRSLQIAEFRIGTIDDVLSTMDSLDQSGRSSNKIKDIRRISPRVTFGFSDLIPLACPMIRLRGSSIIRLPIPSEYSVGLTCHKEGFVIFHHRLKQYIAERDGNVSKQTLWVLRQYEELKEQYRIWEDEVEANEQGNGRDVAFLEKVHTCWEDATKYFIRLQEQSAGGRFRYTDLMACHIIHSINYWGDAWARIRGDDETWKAREHFGLRDWIAEGMHLYFDYLPLIAAEMRSKVGGGLDGGFGRGRRGDGYGDVEEEVDEVGGGSSGSNRRGAGDGNGDGNGDAKGDADVDADAWVYEAWFTMIFRAFCWWRCHYMMPGQDMVSTPSILPARYWMSKLPVYIG